MTSTLGKDSGKLRKKDRVSIAFEESTSLRPPHGRVLRASFGGQTILIEQHCPADCEPKPGNSVEVEIVGASYRGTLFAIPVSCLRRWREGTRRKGGDEKPAASSASADESTEQARKRVCAEGKAQPAAPSHKAEYTVPEETAVHTPRSTKPAPVPKPVVQLFESSVPPTGEVHTVRFRKKGLKVEASISGRPVRPHPTLWDAAEPESSEKWLVEIVPGKAALHDWVRPIRGPLNKS